MTEFSNLLSNTSLLENTENIQPIIELLLYHGPQKLQRIKNIDILISKLISSVYHNSNDSDISIARQLLKGFDSISTKYISTFDIELYNFILSYPQINGDSVKRYLDYIKDNVNNVKSKRYLVKYLSYNLTIEDFVLICESNLFNINELFIILVKRFGLNLININEYLNQKEFIDWINLLKNKDESFFEANYSNSISLLKIIIADHLKIAFNEKANSLSTIDKILVNSYSIVNDLDVTFNANDIISTLGDEKKTLFKKIYMTL